MMKVRQKRRVHEAAVIRLTVSRLRYSVITAHLIMMYTVMTLDLHAMTAIIIMMKKMAGNRNYAVTVMSRVLKMIS